eukprot:TRINITY_DN3582_c0_g1::TRINITY_DN3582_c0_g1_i1::g.18078::m.18078 TRINITY_DN3582_c0_g1::TRINITY_DN3582_c0_g1_i1::g.18078  ORF type:complete len:194 (+),score=15.05,Shikimate_DH/PF01488.15/0.11,Shikimate_DH/PF01488.15/5.6e+03,HTH_Tnp_4/PF13613.1/0.14 TRINITY_DN3582_c0_g1_i1:41-583(+)
MEFSEVLFLTSLLNNQQLVNISSQFTMSLIPFLVDEEPEETADFVEFKQYLGVWMELAALSRPRMGLRRKRILSPYLRFCADESLFKSQVRFTRQQFEQLHDRLKNDIALPRNIYHEFSNAENILRRRRRSRLSTRDRLLMFLIRMRGNMYLHDLVELSAGAFRPLIVISSTSSKLLRRC